MTPKAQMREWARAHRKVLHAGQPEAALQAAAYAPDMLRALWSRLDLDDPAQANTRPWVALYRPRGGEMDTGPLAQVLTSLGCELCLPCVETLDAPLVFRAWRPGETLWPDLVGSEAPLDAAAAVDPVLIITPLLAFDPFGQRLGQGGGYYDRSFAVRPDAARVGLAWIDQELDRLPVEAHDVPLHGVLTETGYIPARKAD